MLALVGKVFALVREVGLAELLGLLDLVQKFLAGEEAEAFVTLRNGIRLRVVVDLRPLSLRIERL